MKIWYVEGLEQATKEGTEVEFLLKYFNQHKHEICFEGCHTIIISETEHVYRTIVINGNDEGGMSFLIQDENQNDLHWVPVKHDFSNLKPLFAMTLDIFFNEELEAIRQLNKE